MSVPSSKDHVDKRFPEHRFTTDEFDLRRGDEAGRDRIGDLVFDQIRRATFPIGIDDHLHVAEVGDGIQRRVQQPVNPGRDGKNGEDDDEEFVTSTRANHPLNQCLLLAIV